MCLFRQSTRTNCFGLHSTFNPLVFRVLLSGAYEGARRKLQRCPGRPVIMPPGLVLARSSVGAVLTNKKSQGPGCIRKDLANVKGQRSNFPIIASVLGFWNEAGKVAKPITVGIKRILLPDYSRPGSPQICPANYQRDYLGRPPGHIQCPRLCLESKT